jgi:hypothetical protein
MAKVSVLQYYTTLLKYSGTKYNNTCTQNVEFINIFAQTIKFRIAKIFNAVTLGKLTLVLILDTIYVVYGLSSRRTLFSSASSI